MINIGCGKINGGNIEVFQEKQCVKKRFHLAVHVYSDKDSIWLSMCTLITQRGRPIVVNI